MLICHVINSLNRGGAETHLFDLITEQIKNNDVVKAIAFNSVGTVLESYLGKNNKTTMNIVGTLISNQWNGKNNIEFVINDISVNNI